MRLAENRELSRAWETVRKSVPLSPIRNERQYRHAVTALNALLDDVGDDESHPLYALLDTLGVLIHEYEEERHRLPDVGGGEMLKYLMEQHGVRQAELPEIGSQGVVSEILSGKRQLNLRQIRALAARFHVLPAVFL